MDLPILEKASWIKDRDVYYIDDFCDSQQQMYAYPFLYLSGIQDLNKIKPSKRKWVNLYHQTAGYACNHVYMTGTFLKPRKEILPLLKTLSTKYDESCISSPPNLKEALEYNGVLAEFGMDASYSYSILQEGLCPIDIEFLNSVTSEKFPQELESLLIKEKGVLGIFRHHWNLAILTSNCD